MSQFRAKRSKENAAQSGTDTDQIFNTTNLWPNAKVPYRFDPDYFITDLMRLPVLGAISIIERHTCVRFLDLDTVNMEDVPTHLRITSKKLLQCKKSVI